MTKVADSGTADGDRPALKVATMTGVREYAEGFDVEVWRSEKQRLIIRAYNEGHNAYTDLDLIDLLEVFNNGWGRELLASEAI